MRPVLILYMKRTDNQMGPSFDVADDGVVDLCLSNGDASNNDEGANRRLRDRAPVHHPSSDGEGSMDALLDVSAGAERRVIDLDGPPGVYAEAKSIMPCWSLRELRVVVDRRGNRGADARLSQWQIRDGARVLRDEAAALVRKFPAVTTPSSSACCCCCSAAASAVTRAMASSNYARHRPGRRKGLEVLDWGWCRRLRNPGCGLLPGPRGARRRAYIDHLAIGGMGDPSRPISLVV